MEFINRVAIFQVVDEERLCISVVIVRLEAFEKLLIIRSRTLLQLMLKIGQLHPIIAHQLLKPRLPVHKLRLHFELNIAQLFHECFHFDGEAGEKSSGEDPVGDEVFGARFLLVLLSISPKIERMPVPPNKDQINRRNSRAATNFHHVHFVQVVQKHFLDRDDATELFDLFVPH